jgi:endoglucanase
MVSIFNVSAQYADQEAVYMVGMHPNSPQNPHSAPASGGDDIGNIRNDPPVPAHVLYGAVVGGPLENDQFWDWRDDWVQTEVSGLGSCPIDNSD